ncbi:TPA: HEAT repeat domain-containing protein [Candidatus Poribacteria bacterium]|nr:HEAT repeat domain-containing protein [Candidatus Poribacteria bacterium]HIC01447.1 HEAT repeat domain-containing protein [Candidatus Poribacteria bacterium]HIO80645.1 HEAT repeat domain-containing protein [Candidatus Poribacteria bacterium]
MFLFVGLFDMWMGGCQTQEQKVEKLISKLQHKNPKVRQTSVVALTKMGKDVVPVLIQALQGQNREIRSRAAFALGRIGTPEALKAVKKYES